jgi:hemoglobin-like flavoprotein
MSTLQRITRKTARIELNVREIAILDACLFDGMVRLLKDSKQFDPIEAEDDAYATEARMEAEAIKGLQRKLEFATTMIRTEETE